MKKFIFLTLLSLMLGMASCSDSKAKLRREVEAANRECPVSLGMIGEMSSVTYDEADNNVIFTIMVSEELVDLSEMQQIQDGMLENLKIAAAKDASKSLLKLVTDAGASLTFTFESMKDTTNRISLTLDNEQLKEALNNDKSDSELNEELISRQVTQENSRCPYLVDEGMYMTKVEDKDGNIIYTCEIDEKLYDLGEMNQVKGEMKEAIKTVLSDPGMQRLIESIVSTNRGIIYRYYGKDSGQTLDLVFTNSELRSN